VGRNFINSLWYIFYIAFLLVMSYIGGEGALSILNFYQSSAMVAVVSAAVFFPWGILSGLRDVKTPKIEEIESQ